MSANLSLPAGVDQFLSDLPADVPIWLVGGAPRDHLLGRKNQDLDFVVDGDALGLARKFADLRGGFFYPLDRERGVGRVIVEDKSGDRYTLDFAQLRGSTIEDDLVERDFSINAIAVCLSEPYAWIDPLGGAGDIRSKIIKTCSPHSILDDPVRALRAIRLALTFGCQIADETRQQIERVKDDFTAVSAERVRDEVMGICDMPYPDKAFRLLDYLGMTELIFPEVGHLRAVNLTSPHGSNALEYTLSVLERLADLLAVLSPVHDPETAANMMLAQVSLRLGRYRDHLQVHFDRRLSHAHRAQQLLFLAALYHTAGLCVHVGGGEPLDYTTVSYAASSAAMFERRGRALRLSKNEIDHIKRIVHHHPEFRNIGFGDAPSATTVYRFFRKTRDVGVEIVLLSLAQHLATNVLDLSQEDWAAGVELGRTLFEAYFEHQESSVNPPTLLNGDEIMHALRLEPGPRVGELLELVREAQVAGEITTRADALSLLRSFTAPEDMP